MENYRQGEERGELNEGLVGDMCGRNGIYRVGVSVNGTLYGHE